MMAFSGTGHISWQTKHSRPSDQGMQVFRSMYARPMTLRCFSSSVSLRMAWVGHTLPHSLQFQSQ
jgi:hypothetical protein